MLNNVNIGSYYQTHSNIHHMNPLAKIICAVLFVFLALFSADPMIAAILSLLVMIMIMHTNIPIYVYWRIIKKMRYLLLVVLLVTLLLTFSLEITLLSLINTLTIVIYLAILNLTTSIAEIIYGFEKLLFPLNYLSIKVNKIALNLTLIYKFIPNLLDQSDRILMAQTSRGLDFKASLDEWLIVTKGLIINLIPLTLRDIKALKGSMSLRLYGINSTRTNYCLNKWGLFDNYLLIIHLFILIVVIMRGVIM